MGGSGRPGVPAPTSVHSVAVIVATRNRPADLERLLESLASQTASDVDVFVIDQSDDATLGRRTVEAIRMDRFTHIAHAATGKSAALNLALGLTSAEVLVFTDDDCVPTRDWVEIASVALAEDGLDLCFGQVLARDGHDSRSEFMPVVHFDRRTILRGGWLRSRPSFGMGANMVARRSSLLAVGGFDQRFGPGAPLRAAEDVELAYRMQRRGRVVGRDPRLSVVHHGARPNGAVASRHVADAFFGIGAVYGAHVRRRDWRALVLFVDELVLNGLLVVRAVSRSERPTHARRLASLGSGFARGFVGVVPD